MKLQKLLSLLLLGALSPALMAASVCRSDTEIPSSTPTENFTDNGDLTVYDHSTGLMWMKCPLGQFGATCLLGTASSSTWKGALEVAASTSFAGFDDWRLPDVKELHSIVEERCIRPAANTLIFPSTPSNYFWTSSPSAFRDNLAWSVNFEYGFTGRDNSTRDLLMHVRLVRSAD